MMDALASAARLIAEPARAAMLVRLMDGRAVPAGELAVAAHVSPQTASEHLAKLVEAGFVTARRMGRHRYFELANEEVGYAVESLMVLSGPPAGRRSGEQPTFGTFAHARACYAHLAGWAGVSIADALQRKGYLVPSENRAFTVTEPGRAWLLQHGISVATVAKAAERKLARQCQDWTERRPHVAGTLGVAMFRRFGELGWIEATRASRVVRITLEGGRALEKHLGITAG